MINMESEKYLKDLKDFKIYVKKNDPGISRVLKKYNFQTKWPREPEFMHIFHKKINPDSKIIDLGANIGYLTLYFKKVLKVKNKILSVEPEITNFFLLKENIKLNNLENEVICKNLAISDKDEDKYFEISNHSNLHKITDKVTSQKVKCKKLSNLLEEENFDPDFIKMDVEGAEIEVIKGFRDYLNKTSHKMSILFEVHPEEYSDTRSFNDELNFLFNIGFKTEFLITAGSKFPNFFKEKGYNSDTFFKSGEGRFKRYIINDVTNKDVLTSINNEVVIRHVNNIKEIIKKGRLFSYYKKIVRGIMLTRN